MVSRGVSVNSDSYSCGDVHLDVSNRRFTRNGVEVALEPKVFAAIVQLVSRAGSLVTRNQLLDAIWGHRYVSPSTINRLIVLARRAFGDDPDEPHFIRTVHGVGYRYTGPVADASPTDVDRVARFGPPAITRLPARIDSLIGREPELARLAELLADARAITVLGTGGIGKTQFALEAARRMAPGFADGVWFFDLAPLKDSQEWLLALAAAVSVSAEGRAQLLEKVCQSFRGRHVLFVLDNCDRIAEGIGAIAVEILLATDTPRILATSQVPLNFKGERLMRLPPLGLPELQDEGTPDLRRLSSAPAVEMLLTRIQAIQPGFELSAANAPAIARICRRLDGLPLALELAAARFSLLSPEQVLERLDHRFRFLKSDIAGRDPRHRTLVALLDWSFTLLSSEERRVLCWFSVFVQGWTVESAIALARPLGPDPEAVIELLTGMANKSLVSVASNLAPPRYQLLETVRDYALEHLRSAAEEPLARAAHLALVVSMSRATHEDMIGGRMPERIDSMVPEHGNIVAAVEYALAARDLDSALAIVGSLAVYIKASGTFELGVACQRVIALTEGIETPDRARALLCLGIIRVHRQIGDDPPQRYLLDAARIARSHGDAWTEAYAAGYYALWLANRLETEEAQTQVDTAQRIAQRRQDPLLLGLAGLARGWLHLARGENAAAIEVLRPVQNLGDDTHQQHFIAMYVGLALFRVGSYPAAATQWLDAMSRAARVGNIRGIAGSVEGCAYLAEKHGDTDKAARFLAGAAAIRERTGNPLFGFWVSHNASAQAALVSRLGQRQYDTAMRERSAREEDVFDEVRTVLAQYREDSRDATA